MKIIGIFLNNELRTGGHRRYLELMEGLALKGHEVTVYLNRELSWKPSHFSDIRVTARYVKGKNIFIGQLFRKNLSKAVKNAVAPTADWIVVFGETHWPSAKFLSQEFGIPILFAFRSDAIQENRMYLAYDNPSFLKRCKIHASILKDHLRERCIVKNVSVVAFQSNSDRDNFLQRNPCANAGKLTVIRGDIRQPRFKPEYALTNTSEQCEKLLFVGALGKRKGLEYLLQAIPLAIERGCSTVHLDILAAGTEFAPYQKIIDETGIASHVTFHGKVTNPLDFMKQSDLLVVPSLFDSYPNTILEAIHVGLPVIGCRSGGIPDMLSSDQLLFSPASAEEIADCIVRLTMSAADYLEARRICANRRSYFDFDWAAEWEKIMTDSGIRNIR